MAFFLCGLLRFWLLLLDHGELSLARRFLSRAMLGLGCVSDGGWRIGSQRKTRVNLGVGGGGWRT